MKLTFELCLEVLIKFSQVEKNKESQGEGESKQRWEAWWCTHSPGDSSVDWFNAYQSRTYFGLNIVQGSLRRDKPCCQECHMSWGVGVLLSHPSWCSQWGTRTPARTALPGVSEQLRHLLNSASVDNCFSNNKNTGKAPKSLTKSVFPNASFLRPLFILPPTSCPY